MSASRSRRTVHTSSASKTTTSSGSSVAAEDLASPLSPARLTRYEEKEQLQHLNDRLSTYIERVRQLESENQRLSFQIRTSEETVVRERSKIKDAYDAELNDARRLLDDTARDRARLQIEVGKWKSQVDELQAKAGKLERDLKDSDGRRFYAESQVQDLTGKLNTSDAQRKHAEDDNRKLQKENEDLRKQLDSARKQLEEETLLRVDLENRLQSLREELAFNKQVYETELGETRSKRQTEIVEINDQLEDEYKQKLQEGLRQMREQFDSQLRLNRKDIEDMYERKLEDLRALADRNNVSATTSRDDMKKMRMEVENLTKDRDEYQGMVAGLERRLKEIERELQNERDTFYGRLNAREEEIRRLNQEITDMMAEYQDLLDIKIRLDVEIEAYRKLLESEETRLRITPSPGSGGGGSALTISESTPRGVQRGTKRKRVIQEQRETETQLTFSTKAHSFGDVEVLDHDTDGAFVKLHNKSENDVALGGWLLKRSAGEEEIIYKFHRNFVLKAGKSVTVWSSDTRITHSPPTDLVMRNQQWPVGDKIRTVLVNPSEEEMAYRESVRTARTERSTFSSAPSAESYLDGADPDQRCLIM